MIIISLGIKSDEDDSNIMLLFWMKLNYLLRLKMSLISFEIQS